MRLDKYLKISRLIKRRTVANEACDAGRVLVNGKTAKASVNVKVGDVIEIQFGTKSVKVEVLDVQETVKKDGTPYTASITGRHDPVIVPRAVVVVECMAALTATDALLGNLGSRLEHLKKLYSWPPRG